MGVRTLGLGMQVGFKRDAAHRAARAEAYVNPHAWLYVVVTDDDGEETLWGFEAP